MALSTKGEHENQSRVETWKRYATEGCAYKIVTGGDPFQYLKSISVMRKMKGPGRKVGEENGAEWINRKREEKCGPSSSYCNVPQNGPEEGSFHAPRQM